jgi:lipopolysaccharide/colanic/teichoic acid biosynthesis glycosyltransferase
MAATRPRRKKLRTFPYRYLKRWFDVSAAAAALVVLSPVLAAIALTVVLTSEGPALFRQERTGRYGKPFFIYKFRTMVRDASILGSAITAAGDPRITAVGRLLRATKLDELPNLVNVLRGEMSIVGPRPDLPLFMSSLTREQREVLQFRPGLTGPTQIRYIAEEELLSPVNIDEDYAENVLQDKIASDLDYVKNWTFGRDLVLVFKTGGALAFKVSVRVKRALGFGRPARSSLQ